MLLGTKTDLQPATCETSICKFHKAQPRPHAHAMVRHGSLQVRSLQFGLQVEDRRVAAIAVAAAIAIA